ACVPEASVRVDVLIVGRLDEYFDRQSLSITVELVRGNLTDLQPPEIDRSAVIERSQVRSLEGEEAAWDTACDHRLRVERHEFLLLDLRGADFHTDVGA